MGSTVTLPAYTYLIADTRTNQILEEVRLTGVKFNKPLNDAGRFNAAWPLGSTTSTMDPYDLSMPCRRAIYALRDDRPIWGGIIWSRAYDSPSRTVKIGAAEFWSYFDHRKVLPAFTPDGTLTQIAGLLTTYTVTEQNTIARQLVQQAQAHTGGDIGIDVDDTTSNMWRDRTYHGYDLTEIGEALRNLANVIGGPDMVFDVLPPADGSGPPRRVLRLGTPHLGQQGSSHVWEVGGNAIDYTWPSDGTRMATRAYASGEGVDLGTPIALYEDTAKYDQGFPVLETEHNYAGAEEQDTLAGHAQADQQASRMPVVLPKIQIRGDIPPTAAEVERGDDGWLVIPADPFHNSGWEGAVRVVDMTFAPSEDAERVTLTMAPLLDGVA